ncbi:MAG: hypothetical protein H0X45_07240, partial [Planctomycetes bacterium]|nr:hypothetical protein [Planctomycetota bacterium]
AMAGRLGTRAYGDVRRLIADGIAEAAVVVTPMVSHHAISIALSRGRMHNLIETTWASMLTQARDMVATAQASGVTLRVAENFLRMPIDRLAQTVRDSGLIGRIGRVFCYADHTGYHNNSRWLAFTRSQPTWVQCVEHVMAHPAFHPRAHQTRSEEALSARFFSFADGFLVADIGSGHVKGNLGRHARPGYTEWHGERGTLVHAADAAAPRGERTELRRCSDDRFAAHQERSGAMQGGGIADQITPVEYVSHDGCWAGWRAQTPAGSIAYDTPLKPGPKVGAITGRDWYGIAVLDHLVDFALAVRGLRVSEFDDQAALMSEMMEIGARQSALEGGRRVALPLSGEVEADALERQRQRNQFGVDPLDAEAMLGISFPQQ